MDNTTHAPTTPQEAPSALMDRLLAVAQAHQVHAEQQGTNGIRLAFAEADVTVSTDHDHDLLVFDCAGRTGTSSEVLSTCFPLPAAESEQGAANAFDFAEMLSMLMGFTATEWPKEC